MPHNPDLKVLQVIESAYRCTIEEQDDPAVWAILAIYGGGANKSSVLLRGNAVSYAIQGQNASGLSFGGVPQTKPPQMDRDIGKFINSGIPVHVVLDDLQERGIPRNSLVPNVQVISLQDIPGLFSQFDQVWHW